MSGMEREASTIEVTPILHDTLSTGSFDRQEPYSIERPEPIPKKTLSLIPALSIATVVALSQLGDEFFRNRRYPGITTSSYIAFQEDDYSEETLTTILAFTLGGPRIIIPTRGILNASALRALAVGKIIMKPIALDFEE